MTYANGALIFYVIGLMIKTVKDKKFRIALKKLVVVSRHNLLIEL